MSESVSESVIQSVNQSVSGILTFTVASHGTVPLHKILEILLLISNLPAITQPFGLKLCTVLLCVSDRAASRT